LPDGLFSNQKSKFGYILEALAMEDVGVFYGRLINFPGIWHILWWYIFSFLVHFIRFGMLYKEKSGSPEYLLCLYIGIFF
jgi:hypothetical protein